MHGGLIQGFPLPGPDRPVQARTLPMHRIIDLLIAILTTGRDHQAFIGARWLVFLLRIAPGFMKKPLALRILALSPHYFYRHVRPEYRGMSTAKWLDAEFERNRSTREKLCDQILLRHLQPEARVLDIGCGPGFLARAVARHAKTVYACDISRGVLECAKILNSASNIQYIVSGESGFSRIEDASLDLVDSFAVIQHLRDSVIRSIFQMAARKLRPGGCCLLQVQLDRDHWKNEEEWSEDRSVTGRLRLQYALNFFPRSEAYFRGLAETTGLSLDAVQPVSELLDDPFDGIFYQHLLILSKSQGALNSIEGRM